MIGRFPYGTPVNENGVITSSNRPTADDPKGQHFWYKQGVKGLPRPPPLDFPDEQYGYYLRKGDPAFPNGVWTADDDENYPSPDKVDEGKSGKGN